MRNEHRFGLGLKLLLSNALSMLNKNLTGFMQSLFSVQSICTVLRKGSASRVCANIFRGFNSYIISFLYLFVSFVVAIVCCCGKTQGKSAGIDGSICAAAIQIALKRFYWTQRVIKMFLRSKAINHQHSRDNQNNV